MRLFLSALMYLMTTFSHLALAPAWAGAEEEKLDYFVKVSQYVDWPDAALGPTFNDFIYGVVGDEDFYKKLLELEKGKWFNGHPVAIKNISHVNAKDLGLCQVLYISVSQKGRLKEILSALKPDYVLTVSDINLFAQKGGMVEFDRKDDRVALSINPGQVEKGKLKMSSRLLQLATIVGSGVDK